jgi:hypothetical protein
VPFGIPRGARCVQRFDDSLNSAIHITYRISLRPSSMREPRDPLLKVVLTAYKCKEHSTATLCLCNDAGSLFRESPRGDAQGVKWMRSKNARGVHDLGSATTSAPPVVR